MTPPHLKPYTLGTWLFGGQKDRDPANDDQADLDVIQMHLEAGVKQIFTAQNYADGWAERLVGQAITDHDRSELTISTAIRKENSSYDKMLRSVEESLERLKLDYLDVVVHHAPSPEVPIEESLRGLNAIVNRGLARSLAVSNYNSQSLQRAMSSTNHPIVFNQVCYNLLVREVEEDGLLELCRQNKVLIQAFRPLEHGEVLTTHTPLLNELAKKYDLTPAQVGLSWLTSQPDVILVCTTRQAKHLKQNLAAVQVQLEPADVERLRAEFPRKNDGKRWLR